MLMLIFKMQREKRRFAPSLLGKAISPCRNHFACELFKAPQCQDTLWLPSSCPVGPALPTRLGPAPCEGLDLLTKLTSHLLEEDPTAFGLLMCLPPPLRDIPLPSLRSQGLQSLLKTLVWRLMRNTLDLCRCHDQRLLQNVGEAKKKSSFWLHPPSLLQASQLRSRSQGLCWKTLVSAN